MKQKLTFLFVLAIAVGFSFQAQAELFNRGTDNSGNRLIYDSDLNITWYDYSNSGDTWQNQMNWASGLTVYFGETIFDDWRLPSTVDGPYDFAYDGTTTGGYNITSSEMGHLFYTELGNKGWYDTAGNPTSCYGSPCLINTSYFQNLQQGGHWSGTENAAYTDDAWVFGTIKGIQGTVGKSNPGTYALAVHDGDVTVVPEPISSILFITGGTLLAGRRFIKRKV